MKRKAVDFFIVEDSHLSVHLRLENWSRWCRGRSVTAVHPMWRMYRADNWSREIPATGAADPLDAAEIQKAVGHLPVKHRHAINWQYVGNASPRRAAQSLGVSLAGLRDLVMSARQMLVDRGF